MPNGDLSEMRHGQPSDPGARPTGMLYGTRELAGALKELGIGATPPPSGLTKWLPTINVILGVVLSLSLGTAFAIYKASSNQLDAATNDIVAIRNEVAALKTDRTARIAKLDEWRDAVETELRVYRVGHAEFQQAKGTLIELGRKLGDGRDERLRDRETDRKDAQQSRDAIIEAISDLKQQVALLRQSMEARGRRSEDNPFGGNQRWNGLPFLGLPAPRSILREILLPLPSAAQILRVADRRPPS